MSSSSCSDSDADGDTERKNMFKEAAINVNDLKDSSSKTVENNLAKNGKDTSNSKNAHLTSSQLDTTPEFRSFIAKKLFETLDRQIKYKKKKLPTVHNKCVKNQGTVLFNETPYQDESEYVQNTDQHFENSNYSDWKFPLFDSSIVQSVQSSNSSKASTKKPQKRKSGGSSSSDSDDYSKFSSVAVSGELILANSQILSSGSAITSKSDDGVAGIAVEQTPTAADENDSQKIKNKKNKKQKLLGVCCENNETEISL